MRMMRRAGLLGRSLPSLSDLFAAMTVETSQYNNGSSSSSNATVRYAKDTTFYYIKFMASGYQIGKIYNANFTYLNGSLTTAPTMSSYNTTQYQAVSSLRGGVILVVSIADYEEKIVDAVFSAIQETKIYGTASSENTTRYVNASEVTEAGLYVVAFGKGSPHFSVSSSEDLYTPIFSYTTTQYTNRVYLYKSGNYVYFSQTGADSTTTYGARLSRLN